MRRFFAFAFFSPHSQLVDRDGVFLCFQENRQTETTTRIICVVNFRGLFFFVFFGSERSQTFSHHIKSLKTSLARSQSALMWNRINARTHFGDAPRVSFPSAERLKSPTLHAVPQSGLMLQTARAEKKKRTKNDLVCAHNPRGAVTSPAFSAPRQNGNGCAYYPDVCPLVSHMDTCTRTHTHAHKTYKVKKKREVRGLLLWKQLGQM